MPSRADIIAPAVLPNGVVVPPGLQVNELTIGEKRAHLAVIGGKLSRAQWVAMFGEAAVEREFGPDGGEPDAGSP